LSNNVRTALGYRTGLFHDFGAYLELEDIRQLGPQRFFNGFNDKGDRFPAIIDPQGTELNQAYLSYQGVGETVFKAGRQLILYRPTPLHRFIGNVVWRQNWQTFDAFSLVNKSLPNTTFSYAFVWNTNRIFGERHPTLSDTQMRSHFINAQYEGLNIGGVNVGNLEGYGYLLDNRLENTPASLPRFEKGDSTKTFGARLYGKQPITDMVDVLYEAEYANQRPFADGRDINRADYVHLQLGGNYKKLTGKVDYELLSGDGDYGFQTQLATSHAFQGWADRSVITPRDGIQDLYFTLKTAVSDFEFMAVYHHFRSDHRNYAFGDEIDLHAIYHLRKDISLNLRSAYYMADDNETNVRRNAAQNLDKDKTIFWAFLEFEF